MKSHRPPYTVLVTLIAAAALLAGCPNRTTTRAPGDKEPTSTVDGAEVDFEAALAPDGETLVLFMTQWCAICEAEQPEVEAWARAHAGTKTIVVIMQSNAAAGRALVAKRKMDTAVLEVLVDPDGSVAKQFGVTATPTLITFAGKAPMQRFYRIAQVGSGDSGPKDGPIESPPAPTVDKGADDAATDPAETEATPE